MKCSTPGEGQDGNRFVMGLLDAAKLHPITAHLPDHPEKRHNGPMSTVTEIEAAIEKLPPTDYRELLAWIEEHQAMVGASEALFVMYDEEEEAHAKSQTR